MKLRKAWLFLTVLLIAAAAQADPVSVKLAESVSHSSTSTGSISIQAIASVPLSNSAAQAPGFSSSVLPRPVPEPATLALFGSGLLGIAAMVRRRTRGDDDASDKK